MAKMKGKRKRTRKTRKTRKRRTSTGKGFSLNKNVTPYYAKGLAK